MVPPIPSAWRLVTPCVAIPHGTMPPKCDRSGEILTEKPCSVTQRFTRTPMAPILASAAPSPVQIPIRDHPSLERMDEAANVLAAAGEVEGQVADPLARPVIGVPPAAAGVEHGKALRVEQLGRVGAGPSGEQGWVFEQPDPLGQIAGLHRRRAGFHVGQRRLVRHQRLADLPLDAFDQLHGVPMRRALAKGQEGPNSRRMTWSARGR